MDALAAGGTVLVHCQMGSSRSASFVIAWLMTSEDMTFEQALDKVVKCRPCVRPNKGFEAELRKWGWLSNVR